MELKLSTLQSITGSTKILIEPFGIETLSVDAHHHSPKILIEPFGIETLFVASIFYCFGILIEPFGIETCFGNQAN